jgi:hypothetical protein
MLTLFGAFLAAVSGVALITWWARDQVTGRPATSQPDLQPGDVTVPGCARKPCVPTDQSARGGPVTVLLPQLPDKIDKSLVRSVPSSVHDRRKVSIRPCLLSSQTSGIRAPLRAAPVGQ